MVPQSQQRHQLFISYSHSDVRWLRRLQTHLRPLERDCQIHIWDDTKISAGAHWRAEIRDAITNCKAAVLLVSPEFLASDFIAQDELPSLLTAAQQSGTRIFPVILSASRYLHMPSLSQFQAVNDPSKGLIGLSRTKQDAILVRVSESIERCFREINRHKLPYKQDLQNLSTIQSKIGDEDLFLTQDRNSPDENRQASYARNPPADRAFKSARVKQKLNIPRLPLPRPSNCPNFLGKWEARWREQSKPESKVAVEILVFEHQRGNRVYGSVTSEEYPNHKCQFEGICNERFLQLMYWPGETSTQQLIVDYGCYFVENQGDGSFSGYAVGSYFAERRHVVWTLELKRIATDC